MALDVVDTLQVLEGARSFEHGKKEIQLYKAISSVYGEEREKDYSKCEESDLRVGLSSIYKAVKGYLDLEVKVPIDDRLPGAYHNDQMFAMQLGNAIDELEGKRASSASLISTICKISDFARTMAVEKHFQKWYPFGVPEKVKDKISEGFYRKHYESGKKLKESGKWMNYPQIDAMKKEDYIRTVEQRVKDLAPKWEEETKSSRLETKGDSQRS